MSDLQFKNTNIMDSPLDSVNNILSLEGGGKRCDGLEGGKRKKASKKASKKAYK